MAQKAVASKYKYLFGTASQPSESIGGIALGNVSPDSNVIKANPKFIAIPWKITGGLAVINTSTKGALAEDIPLILEDQSINEFSFNPFDDNTLATAGNDGAARIYNIPDGGLTSNVTAPIATLAGHSKRLMYVDWHPLASEVLCTAAGDEIKIWDVSTNQPKLELPKVHKAQVTSITWNYDGSVCATACKDKSLRVIDPRGSQVVAETLAHQGAKGWRAVWLGSRDRILTVGFTKTSDREVALWDVRALGKALSVVKLDNSPAAPMPFFDPDTGVLYLSSKGEGTIKMYEVQDNLVPLTDFKSPTPTAGMAMLPKRVVELMKCEVARFLKLTPNGQIFTLRFEVPRQNMSMFNEDLYPDTWDGKPVSDSSGWFGGESKPPHLISLKP